MSHNLGDIFQYAVTYQWIYMLQYYYIYYNK
jgi:hypothetical protein